MSPDILIYSLVQNGTWRLGRLEIPTLTAHDYPMEFSSLSGVHASATTVVLRCATMTSPPAIATVDVNTGAVSPIKLLVPSDSLQKFQNYFSTPQPIEFPTSNGDIAHAFYYRPYNPDWQAPASERPPLLVKSHGGPTTATDSALTLAAAIVFAGGVQLMFLGVIGEYIGRIYDEVRLRPSWIVWESVGISSLAADQRTL